MQRRRLPRLLLNAATALSLVLAVFVAVLWARRATGIQDEIVWNIRSPAERRTATVHLRSGTDPARVQLLWSQCVFARREDFEAEDPADASNRLAARSALPMRPGVHFVSRRLPRYAPTGTYWYRHGFSLRWPAADPAPPGAAPATWASGWAGVPHWLLVLAFSVLPGILLLHRLRAARAARRGRCPACGYDLRATPDRCPECGTVPVRP